MVLKPVHHVLNIDQPEWLKPFVEFETEIRQKSKTALQQQFY